MMRPDPLGRMPADLAFRLAIVIGLVLLAAPCSNEDSTGAQQSEDQSALVDYTTAGPAQDVPRREFSRRKPGSVIASAGLTRFESCDDLQTYLQRETAATVTAFGYGADLDYGQFGDVTHRTKNSTYRPAERQPHEWPVFRNCWLTLNSGYASTASSDYLVFVHNDAISIVDISGPDPELAGTLRFDAMRGGVSLQEILLHEDRLLLVYMGGLVELPLDPTEPDVDPHWGSANRKDLRINTVVVDVGLEDGEPRVLRELRLRGSYVGAEISEDGLLRLVTGYEQRRLPGETHPGDDGLSEQDSLEYNRELARATPLDAWMPEYRLTDGSGALVAAGMLGDCMRAYRLSEFAGPGMLSITTLDLGESGLEPPIDVVSLVASSARVNSDPDSLYVTTSPYFYELGASRVHRAATDDPHADVHRFGFSQRGIPQYSSSVGITGWAGGGRVVDDTLRLLYSWHEHPDDQYLDKHGLVVFDITDDGLTFSRQAEIHDGTPHLVSTGHTSGAIVLVGFPPGDEDAHAHVAELSDPTGEVLVRESVVISDIWAGFVEIGGDLLLHVGDEYGDDNNERQRTVLLLDVAEPRNPRIAVEAGRYEIDALWSAHRTDDGAVAVIPLTSCNPSNCVVAVITATPDGLTPTGTIAHRDIVVTSELVGNTLYTITPTDLIATDLSTMGRVARIPWWTE